jgi:hypothetical protein
VDGKGGHHVLVVSLSSIVLVLFVGLCTFVLQSQQNPQPSLSSHSSTLLPLNNEDATCGVILFPEAAAAWEVDYVPVDLLADLKSLSSWKYYNYGSWEALVEFAKDIGTCDTRSMILVFNKHALSIKEAEQFVTQFKPQILIQLSDEDGNQRAYLEGLAPRVPLMLREYWHGQYPVFPNVYQIPLGYMTGMLDGTSSINRQDVKPMVERSLQWSFIGSLKQDRQEMIDTFSDALPEAYFVSHNASAPDTLQHYNDAIFVPNGRGWVTLDCLRLYEASLAGAIPIVVGAKEETSVTFQYEGDRPPWIFEPDWNRAAKRCRALLEGPREVLQAMQEQNLAWWKTQILLARSRIQKTLLSAKKEGTRGRQQSGDEVGIDRAAKLRARDDG